MTREKGSLSHRRIPGFRPTEILVHYDEITLKGRNRSVFENALTSSVRRALDGAGAQQVQRRHGRVVVELKDPSDADRCAQRLKKVFGVTRFMPSGRCPANLDAMRDFLRDALAGTAPDEVSSFAVRCKRANKNLPLRSGDVHREIGQHIVDTTGWKVQLDDPDLTVFIRLISNEAHFGFDQVPGPGGLPNGTTGRVACLLSGGIDSPVAAHQILRRGATPVFVHFHSAPHTSAASQDKVRELATVLLPYGHRSPLYMVPFADTQQRIIMECPSNLRVVLYRRFMMRAAEAIARRERALATVTGDSLGQVASQTLENMSSIHAVTTLPALRPLIGLHKIHIVEEARRIGTYDLSIEPHDDCCSYLMPKNPATQTRPEQLTAAEEKLDVDAEVASLFEAAEYEIISGIE
ncbi:MAG: tRNA uracil 4-sulfurtransferase ThiI [Planctomycetota bacterium]